MKFKPTRRNFSTVHISGRYKCEFVRAGTWKASFKWGKLREWGNAVEKANGLRVLYHTLGEAKDACARHLGEFGADPDREDVLKELEFDFFVG